MIKFKKISSEFERSTNACHNDKIVGGYLLRSDKKSRKWSWVVKGGARGYSTSETAAKKAIEEHFKFKTIGAQT